jgi:RNA polymerase sigma-70 factor (ECF subfamily)
LTLTKQNIETLLVLCKKGNQLAQMEVYNRYQAAMYNVSARIVKDKADAEDIMQESFITAFSKLDMFKGEATFGSWLKRIVINNSISHYKKNQRLLMLDKERIADPVDEPTFDGISEDDCTNTKAVQVMNCLDSINKNYKQILTLHLIEGYDYEEICEILQISYANCRTMISRAKESLRNKLLVTP